MWLFTREGYFSIVQKPGERNLTIRARVRDDLENLRQSYFPGLKIIDRVETDYPYRAKVSHKAFANAVKEMVLDIQYGNFKEMVAEEQGVMRSVVYGRVWSVLTCLEREEGQELGRLGEEPKLTHDSLLEQDNNPR